MQFGPGVLRALKKTVIILLGGSVTERNWNYEKNFEIISRSVNHFQSDFVLNEGSWE